jgi:nucleotide-binding universal stress UspA family protein
VGQYGEKEREEKRELNWEKNVMAGKIFYRERRKVGKDEKKPRFKIVAVADVDLTVYADHLRKQELEQIAQEIAADLVLLKSGKGSEKEVEV